MSRCSGRTARGCCKPSSDPSPGVRAGGGRFGEEGFWDGCPTRCIATFLVVVNFVCLVSGGCLVFLGCFLLSDTDSSIYVDLLDRLPSSGPLIVLDKIPLIFISVGLVIVIFSFLGCYGTCVESVCCLAMYTVLLFTVLVGELLVGTLCVVLRDKISQRLVQRMQTHIRTEYNKTALPANVSLPATVQVTYSWDLVQVRLQCCGALGPRDYEFSAWNNNTKAREAIFVPPSCCVLWTRDDYRHASLYVVNDDQCQIDAILYAVSSSALNAMGCGISAVRWFETNWLAVLSVLCALTILQIVHFGCACSTLARIRRSQSNYEWYDGDGYSYG